MSAEIPVRNGNGQKNNAGEDKFQVKSGLAKMLKGGVIMDVVNAEQVRNSALPLTASRFATLTHLLIDRHA